MAAINGPCVLPTRILRTILWSSALSKLTANAFPSIAAVWEATGGDVQEVASTTSSGDAPAPLAL